MVIPTILATDLVKQNIRSLSPWAALVEPEIQQSYLVASVVPIAAPKVSSVLQTLYRESVKSFASCSRVAIFAVNAEESNAEALGTEILNLVALVKYFCSL